MDWLQIVSDEKQCCCTVKISEIPKTKTVGIDLAVTAILDITKNYKPPYILFCSGGVDSQAMAYAWKKSNIKHEIILYQFIDDQGNIYNDHDLKTFFVFAEKNEINYSLKKFNYFKFLENDLVEYAKTYDCASPQITGMIKMIELVGTGTIILSGNFWNYAYHFQPLTYDILGLYRFKQTCVSFSLIPFFFLYNSELAFGFKLPDEPLKESYKNRCQIYKLNGFPIIPQDDKTSGFEKIKDYFDTQKHLINSKDRLRFLNKLSKRVFDIKYRYMLREQIGKELEFKIILE